MSAQPNPTSSSESTPGRSVAQNTRELRSRLLSGEFTADQFRYLAARTYLSQGKPLRARPLLMDLSPDFRPSPDLPTVLQLKSEAEQFGAPGQAGCTLTMIVRDEQALIMRALDSVDELVDQIIVADTGSSDRTPHLAALYGATVVHTPWEEDFSKARNTTLTGVCCTWVLWMDADDRIDPACVNRLRDLWSRSAASKAFAFRITNERPGNRGPEFMQIRLFPARQTIRFERRIHEQVLPSLQREGIPVVAREDIRIIHSGYQNQETHKRKARRNLPLVRAELERAPDDPSLLLSLGDCHTILGDVNGAICAYSRLVARPDLYWIHGEIYTQALFYLGWLNKRNGTTKEAKRNLFKCAFADPTRTEALHLLGVIFFEEEHYDRAFELFMAGARTQTPVRTTATDRTSIRMESLSYIIRILLRWRRLDEAEDIARKALAAFPNVVEYYSLLAQVLFERGALQDAARQFMRSISLSPHLNPDAFCGVARIYLKLDEPERAAEFLQRGMESGSTSGELFSLMGDTLFSLHRPEAALSAYDQALAWGMGTGEHPLLFWKALSSALESGNSVRARELAQQVHKMDPTNLRARQLVESIDTEEERSHQVGSGPSLDTTQGSGIGTAKPAFTIYR